MNVYRLNAPVTIPGVHRFGNFDINAVQGGPSPALTETTTLPAGTLYIPMDQGNKHWIQGVLGENPFLPFHYFYDKVTWSYSLLRGFAGDGFLTQQLPAGASMTQIADPAQGTAPATAQPVYAFNTDSMAGLAMVNQLLGQGASVARGAAAFDSGGVHFATGAALVDGASIPLATIAADADQWQTPVYGLGAYPVSHYALSVPKIGVYTGGTTAPTNPAFHGTGDGQCTSTAYCEVMFALTQKEGIPTSQIGQMTSTDLANGVLVSGTTRRSSIRARRSPRRRRGLGRNRGGAAGVHQRRRIYVGTLAGGAASLRNAGVTTVNTNTVSGISTPGSTFDATWNTSDPVAWGFDAGGWIYREASSDPNFDPATLAGNGGTIPAATAVATYAPAGDCGGPAGFGNCYGYEVNANTNLPGRPAVIDQPFGCRARDHARLRRLVSRVDDAGRATRPERHALPARLGDPAGATCRRAAGRIRAGAGGSCGGSGAADRREPAGEPERCDRQERRRSSSRFPGGGPARGGQGSPAARAHPLPCALRLRRLVLRGHDRGRPRR